MLFQGLERGLQMNHNLIGDWDLFADAAVPVEELRQRYGIPPRQTCSGLQVAVHRQLEGHAAVGQLQ